MAGFAAVWQSMQRLMSPPVHPMRLIAARRVRLFAAVGAGGLAGAIMLLMYYATLGLLPPAFAYPATEFPLPAWAHRLDLAQFAGTMIHPPVPTALTWWLGITALFATLTTLGTVYAVLLAWTLQRSDVVKGFGFGVLLFFGLGMFLTIANGLHPAIMRNALPDTGLFLLGWSPHATIQLLLALVLYGGILGELYRRWTLRS